ncbi:MAG: SPASM domain-containing protein [Bacteroidales bacterium]|nr:SPASM domain-containing protein [Bacteroidales bacterium]
MKFSFYNEPFEAEGKKYLYNIFSTALIEVDDELFSAVKSDNTANVNTEYIEPMKAMHFIVNDEVDEYEEYLYFYNSVRYGNACKILQVIFIPSYNCNLRCPYCMQGLNKERKTIDDNGISAITNFIQNKVSESRSSGVPISELSIILFGGEPLIAKKSIIKFCETVKETADKLSCRISFSMTSNFTLVDDEVIEFIQRYNITTQVSFDGTKEQHDKSRIGIGGKGTYDVILSNIKRMNDEGLKNNVVVRLNIDKNNIQDAEEIMAAVAPYSNDVYFGFVDKFKGSNDAFSECISNHDYADIIDSQLSEIYKKYGYPIPRPFGKMAPCSLNTENRFIIDSELNVYKCEVIVNHKDTMAGHITKDGFFVPSGSFFSQMGHTPERNPKCLKCKLLPLCGGGCVAKKYIREDKKDGNFSEVDCFMDEETLLKYLKAYAKRQQQ